MAERYDDMAASMKSVTEAGAELSNEVAIVIDHVTCHCSAVGEEPAVCGVQERGGSEEELLEGHLLHRAEDRGQREEAAAGQGVQGEGEFSLNILSSFISVYTYGNFVTSALHKV